MADLGETFDTQTVEPNTPRDLKPEGWYPGMIVESERKATKAEDGSEYLNLELVHIDPSPFKGQPEWDILNLWNKKSEKAVQIARGTLSQIGRSVGVHVIKDSTQLHNLPLMFKLVIEEGGDGVKRNKIKGYKAVESGGQTAAPAATGASAPASSSPAKASGGAAPWGKKATG